MLRFAQNRLRWGFLLSLFCGLLTLAGTPASAQDAVLARITVPIKGQTVRGSITIQGTATAPQIARYQVDFAAEPDLAVWTLINAGLDSVDNNILAVWNTRPIPDGVYAIRVQVYTSEGLAAEAYVRELTLANAVSVTPVAPGAQITTSATTETTDTVGADAANQLNLDLADLPNAFLSGARYAAIAFAALGGYVLVKRLFGLAIRKLFPRHVDYGH